jgi:hypothetical protein
MAASLQTWISPIVQTVANSKTFKVGKTGQHVDDRFRTGHADNYKLIKEIGFSASKKEIDDIEIELIKYFKANFKNCDNEQHGGGDMGPSNKYSIYVVWN